MTAKRRGYSLRLHSRSRWEKLRAQVLAEEPICRCDDCRSSGRVRVSDEVDHIVSIANGGTDARENLRGINHDCHVIKSARERGYSPKLGVDEHGWPRHRARALK